MKKQQKNRFSSMMYKGGGEKQEWISNKISTLMDEGKSREQAIAMALNMADNQYQNGGQQKPKIDLTQENLPSYYKSTAVSNPNVIPTYTVDGVEYEVSRLGALRPKGTLAPTEFGAVSKNSPIAQSDDFSRAVMEISQNKLQPERSKESLFELNRGYILDDKGNRIRRVDIPDVNTFYQNGGQQPTAGYYFGNTNPYPFSGDMYKQYQFPESVNQYPSTTYNPTQINQTPNNFNFPTSFQTNTPAPSEQDFQMWNNAFNGQNSNNSFSAPNVQENIGFNQGEQYLGLGKNPSYTNPLQEQTSSPQNEPQLNLPNQNDFQFFNPYGGVDLESSAQFLGESIGSGDTAGIIAGGLKTGLGTARNIFGGMGLENRKQEAMQNYYNDQRDTIVGQPQRMQEGGMIEEGQEEINPEQLMAQVAQAIQEGADPQQIVQQLVSMGLSEEEAMQIIQMVMGQQQEQPMMKNGGEYLDMLRGKRIKDYKLNSETGNYEIIYE